MDAKKYIITVGAIAGMFAISSFGLSQGLVDSAVAAIGMSSRGTDAKEMVLQVGPKGEALLRGTVSAVGTSTLTVKGWGGDWTVNTASAKFMPEAVTVAVGDFVGVQGSANQTAAWTVDARLVRDWTSVKSNLKEKMQKKAESKANTQASE